ncbi:hypothetical protein LINPERHAP1_LOCUS35188 [Linum perenne]
MEYFQLHMQWLVLKMGTIGLGFYNISVGI